MTSASACHLVSVPGRLLPRKDIRLRHRDKKAVIPTCWCTRAISDVALSKMERELNLKGFSRGDRRGKERRFSSFGSNYHAATADLYQSSYLGMGPKDHAQLAISGYGSVYGTRPAQPHMYCLLYLEPHLSSAPVSDRKCRTRVSQLD